MDLHSDRLFTHTDAFAPSSPSASFPRRRWSQLSPLHTSPVVETVRPSQSTHPYRNGELSLTESSRAHRATALRQLNGYARPLSGKSRPATSRPSTLGSQPVLVRTYSGGPNETSTRATMPSRRSFLFSPSSSSRTRGPALPSEGDFSIDGILRAIEPDIRHTLDAIGEICGRSKLSLANEYGSHIAPLGEIRAPPGGLLTVEEASSDHERQADNVVIYDDENSVADGRDAHSGPPLRYWDHVRQTATGEHSRMISLPGYSSSVQAQPATRRSSAALQPAHDETCTGSLSTSREITSKSGAGGRALLGTNVENESRSRAHDMITPALVSETLLEAQAENRHLHPSMSPPQAFRHRRPLSTGNLDSRLAHAGGDHPSGTSRPTSLFDVRSLFGWLRYIMSDDELNRSPATAEMRLRAMLERQSNGHDE
ncbi:uncharacterized protein BO97DRAFT_407862 [Aspergillus homomorphus CBS 101889]|uniref:Uncharacterized protein n=1 Tax=Aspergillus homomorphus (strain CBS 101889) TaxID=1450537 RepID=A0A395HMG8_ASPHC|nr:hypothetical protein BO97DRAFT_407862 [Aspergillus homomorphus CBS 101889]RAL09132.1 hypothetical protein BO97DRAFT_407862 [Aspergillus homomorphus CBS 101889]